MMLVDIIGEEEALPFVDRHHYSNVMPSITKHYLGAFQDGEMVGVLTLGWGTRPRHTIQRIFPDLITTDYLEIGKMAMSDQMPRNSESQFLSAVVKWMQKHLPEVQFLYTWADGMVGKPGYVYQASNFWYGGFVWTDTYLNAAGEKIHPRTMQTRNGARPNADYMHQNGIRRFQGKQFRYIYPLSKSARKMLPSSPIYWSQKSFNFPKHDDLEWFELTPKGHRRWREVPPFKLRNLGSGSP